MSVAEKTIEQLVNDAYDCGRNEAIEECARVVEEMAGESWRLVAAAIRAKKDKP